MKNKTITIITSGYFFRDPRYLYYVESYIKHGYNVKVLDIFVFPKGKGECNKNKIDEHMLGQLRRYDEKFEYYSYESNLYSFFILPKVSKHIKGLSRTLKSLSGIKVMRYIWTAKSHIDKAIYKIIYSVSPVFLFLLLFSIRNDKQIVKIIDSSDMLHGAEFLCGSLILYFLNKKAKKDYIINIKEFHVDLLEDRLSKFLINKYEARLIEKAVILPCVSPGIIAEHLKTQGLAEKFVLLPNVVPISHTLKKNVESELVVNPRKGKKYKIILSSSYCKDDKGIEQFLEVWEKACVENAELYVRLANIEAQDLLELKCIVKNTIGRSVFFVDSVHENNLVKSLDQYDIGVISYPQGVNFNYDNCCPNKLGQYLAAGLALIANNTKYVSEIINTNQLGCVYTLGKTCQQQEKLQAVTVLKKFLLDEQKVIQSKLNAIEFYKSYFNWEEISKTFFTKLECILSDTHRVKIAVVHSVKNIDTIQATVKDSLLAFGKYSQHDVDYFYLEDVQSNPKMLAKYNGLVFHYYAQVYTSFNNNLMKFLKKFTGKKIIFCQDDYDHPQKNLNKYINCKIDILYSPISSTDTLNYIYPKDKCNNIQIKHYLTGYIPDDLVSDIVVREIRDRKIDVFYRGNDVGCAYGTLGYEKHLIGVVIKELLKDTNLTYDIECSINKQIYGKKYLKMMASARATLVTESGSSIVFNQDKYMKERLDIINRSRNSDELITPEKIRKLYPEYFSRDGKYVVSEISPKCFEAILCKTAIIGYEGHYSKVLKPGVHYIVLKKNHSNIKEVITKLYDTNYLQDLVDFVYDDIVLSGKYSYKSFIESFDEVVA